MPDSLSQISKSVNRPSYTVSIPYEAQVLFCTEAAGQFQGSNKMVMVLIFASKPKAFPLVGRIT